MAPLLIIGFLVAVAVGLFVVASRSAKGTEERWRAYAESHGGRYLPKAEGRASPTIEVSMANVPLKIFVHVGTGEVGGVQRAYNSLRASAPFQGPQFQLLYTPSLQAEPVLVGDDSTAVRSWLSAVDASVRSRDGLAIGSDGATLHVDLPRNFGGEKVPDFDLAAGIISKLVSTQALVSGR